MPGARVCASPPRARPPRRMPAASGSPGTPPEDLFPLRRATTPSRSPRSCSTCAPTSRRPSSRTAHPARGRLVVVLTRWGRTFDPDRPLPEYPRPQLARERWVNLNGIWEHAFTARADLPSSYDGPIVVPFSPEAPLSGVDRQLRPEEWLWYRRSFTAPDLPPGGRMLLHFGAVDQSCTVWVNTCEVGSHTGGYLPFTLDVNDGLSCGESEHALEVRVRDLSETGVHARGKQRLDRGTIWYTAQSGIWQTVWLEPVPATYVERLVLVPRLELGALEVTVVVGGGFETLAHARSSTTEMATVQV